MKIMLQLNGDDVATLLHIVTLAASSGALHGKKAQDIFRPPSSTVAATSSSYTGKGVEEVDGESSHDRQRNQLKNLEKDLIDISQGFGRVRDVTKHVSIIFKTLEHQANALRSVCGDLLSAPDGNISFLADQFNDSIKGLTDIALRLKSELPGKETVRVESASDLINYLVKQSAYEKFQGCLALQDFEKNYRSLDLRLKHCLFCFSVFPEGYVVRKTSLMYWWVGEGLIDPKFDGDKNAEEAADEIVRKFVQLGFVEPVTQKRKFVGLKMHPVLRFAVTYLAERAGFLDFDFTWNPTADFRLCHRACLVETEEGSSHELLMKDTRLNPGKLQALFNVNDHFPDLTAEWFSRIRNVNVLRLGIPVAETDILRRDVLFTGALKGLKNMKHLKFLGLQGIFGIRNLPDDIGKLVNLRILDLKACYLLEALPGNIRSLRSLTHLDVSKCYGVHRMPKGIGQLTELQVLMGFVIDNSKSKSSATLHDLAGLKKLRKLSVYTDRLDFPVAEELDALWSIKSLRKLTLAWNRSSFVKPGAPRDLKMLTRLDALQRQKSSARLPTLPPNLEKLKLRGFPHTKVPDWLTPDSLKSLKKLYIRGGELLELGHTPEENDKWKVRILRLKYLSEFQMDWRRVQDIFPELIYLETCECPELTSFPCDKNGVWLSSRMLPQNLFEELGLNWSFLAASFGADDRQSMCVT